MSGASRTYCLDTSVLIELHRGIYPRAVFPGIWDDLEQLVDDGRMVAPREVRRELDDGRDDLTTWAKTHKNVFLDPEPAEYPLVGAIQQRFSTASTVWLTKAPHADPWIVAMAQNRKLVVLTAEKWGQSIKNPKLPFVCEEFGVRWLNIVDFLVEEGLSYPSAR